MKLKVRRGSCVCVRSCGCIGDGRGPTRSRRVPGAGHECWRPCSPRVGPTECGVHEALRVVTFAAGFRCGPVSDVEGSRASCDGAPPWAGTTWTARLRSAVSEIRRQKSQIQLLLCSESTNCVLQSYTRPGARRGSTRSVSVGCQLMALPQGSITAAAQCCGVRSARGPAPIPIARALLNFKLT